MALQGDTKKRILDTAEGLLLEGGFDGFSYKHVASDLGIKNAAVHYHYPAKSDLGLAIIQRTRRRFRRWCDEIDKREEDPAKKLGAFFGIFKPFVDSGKVCFGGALAIGFKRLPVEMQAEARAMAADFLAWLENLLDEGRKKGAFTFPGNSKDQAIVILASIQGVLQIARETDPTCFDIVERQFMRSIKA